MILQNETIGERALVVYLYKLAANFISFVNEGHSFKLNLLNFIFEMQVSFLFNKLKNQNYKYVNLDSFVRFCPDLLFLK